MENFEQHLEMVKAIYNKHFMRYKWLRDDLIQEGNIALLKACERFDASKGVKFVTFAYKCIKMAMLDLVRQELKLVERFPVVDIEKFDNAVICEDIHYVELKDSISKLNDNLTKKVLYLALNGFNKLDMCELLGEKYRTIYRKIEHIREFLPNNLL